MGRAVEAVAAVTAIVGEKKKKKKPHFVFLVIFMCLVSVRSRK
jgi:hypothetical protein